MLLTQLQCLSGKNFHLNLFKIDTTISSWQISKMVGNLLKSVMQIHCWFYEPKIGQAASEYWSRKEFPLLHQHVCCCKRRFSVWVHHDSQLIVGVSWEQVLPEVEPQPMIWVLKCSQKKPVRGWQRSGSQEGYDVREKCRLGLILLGALDC